ncbi:hypothetical protein D3C72_788390 [compost metagenome]
MVDGFDIFRRPRQDLIHMFAGDLFERHVVEGGQSRIRQLEDEILVDVGHTTRQPLEEHFGETPLFRELCCLRRQRLIGGGQGLRVARELGFRLFALRDVLESHSDAIRDSGSAQGEPVCEPPVVVEHFGRLGLPAFDDPLEQGHQPQGVGAGKHLQLRAA